MGDRDDAPAAEPPQDAAPRTEGGAASGAKPTASGLRATPPYMIVAAAFLVAVLAGVGVTAIEYLVQTQSVRGRALSDLAAVQVQPAVPAVPAPSVAELAAAPPTPAAAPAPPVASMRAPARRAPAIASAPAAKPAAKPQPAQRNKATKEPLKIEQVRKTERIVVSAVEQRVADDAVKPATLDDRYESAVRKKCRCGALGLPCREMVRWRLCKGRWNDGSRPDETRCYVRRDTGTFPPVVIGSASR